MTDEELKELEKAEKRIAAVLHALRAPLDSEDDAEIVAEPVERAEAKKGGE
jgi:hypothetical protein